MAKFKVGSGISKYTGNLNALLFATEEQMGRSIYEGARIVAKEMAAAIDRLPVQNKGRQLGLVTGITSAQKAGLKEGMGIARMRSEGSNRNVKVGFDGYNRTKTDNWPKGQPNAMIARAVESGTSFMAPHPFVEPTIRKTKAAAEKAMAEEFDRQVKKTMGV